MAKRNGVGRASKLATGIPPGEERSPNLRAVAALQEHRMALGQASTFREIVIENLPASVRAVSRSVLDHGDAGGHGRDGASGAADGPRSLDDLLQPWSDEPADAGHEQPDDGGEGRADDGRPGDRSRGLGVLVADRLGGRGQGGEVEHREVVGARVQVELVAGDAVGVRVERP